MTKVDVIKENDDLSESEKNEYVQEAGESPTYLAFQKLEGLRQTMPVSSYSRISELSLYYEKSWTPERILTIEECLSLAEKEDEKDLLERLLEIDITMGVMRQAVISRQQYYDRFPSWKEIIDNIYDQIGQQTITGYGRLGVKIGHYMILEVLGKGAMGVVYKAWDESLHRTVAIKYLLPQHGRHVAAETQMMKLFQHEIALLGQLKRDTMFAQAYDSGKDGDFLYLVMEYVEGMDLAKYVKSQNAGKLPFFEAIQYIRQIAEGLKEIHELGIIHRDIKPENIIRDSQGNIRILDLGVGLLKDSSVVAEKLLKQQAAGQERVAGSVHDEIPREESVKSYLFDTGKNKIAGTPAYWAPEAYFTPEAVDARSDLFSLGGTFFFLLTGILPNKWRDCTVTVPGEVESLKDFLTKHAVILPADGLAMLEKMLEKEPDRRYNSAQEMIAAIDCLMEKHRPRSLFSRWRVPIQIFAVMILLFCSLVTYRQIVRSRQDVNKFQSAREMKSSGQDAQALALLVDVEPGNLPSRHEEDFFYLRGCLYEELAKDEEYLHLAYNDYSRVLEINAENLECLCRHIRLDILLGNKKKARESVIQALKQYPQNELLQTLDAQILIQFALDGDVPPQQKKSYLLAAVEILDEVLQRDIHFIPALFWRARAYHAMNHVAFALHDLEYLLKLNRDYPLAWLLMADLHFTRENWAEAISCWDYVQRRNPNLSFRQWNAIYLKWAQSLFNLQQYPQCIACCNRARDDRFETLPQIRRYRAEAAFLAGQWSQAMEDLHILLDMQYLFSENERQMYRSILAFCTLQQAREQIQAAQPAVEMLKECVVRVDELFASGISSPWFVFHGREWNLWEIRRQANLFLGNTEDARADSERLLAEMQEQFYSRAKMELESQGLSQQQEKTP
ncbi:MAG: protein kinase [Planctomycetia bacterium]|nr:protein kinase [Planctomycetia bacterium]